MAQILAEPDCKPIYLSPIQTSCQDCELVSAKPGTNVIGKVFGVQGVCDGLKNLITSKMVRSGRSPP